MIALLGRRERRRVDAFVAAIRATAPAPVRPMPVPLPRVEQLHTPHGVVWQLDEPSRARLPRHDDTVQLSAALVRLLVPLR